MNIDADFNKEFYDKGYMPATMGCRTYLMKNVNGEPGCKGRGNIAPVTINLPRVCLLYTSVFILLLITLIKRYIKEKKMTRKAKVTLLSIFLVTMTILGGCNTIESIEKTPMSTKINYSKEVSDELLDKWNSINPCLLYTSRCV